MTPAQFFLDLQTKFSKNVSESFKKAIGEIKDDYNMDSALKAIASDDIEALVEAIQLEDAAFDVFADEVDMSFKQGGGLTFKSLLATQPKKGPQFIARFSVRNPRAEEYARQLSSKAVTRVVDEQKAIIRTIVEDAISKGDNPKTIVKKLVGEVNKTTGKREGGVIGLSEPFAKYVMSAERELQEGKFSNYLTRKRRDRRFDKWVKESEKTGKPLTGTQIQKMINQYSNRLLALRAQTIGRTEAMAALGAAQYEVILQLIDTGKVTKDQVTKIWDATGDKRTRLTHAVADGQEVGIEEFFTMASGAKLRYPGDPVAPAGEIINCRCILKLKVDWLKGIRKPQAPVFRAEPTPKPTSIFPKTLDRVQEPPPPPPYAWPKSIQSEFAVSKKVKEIQEGTYVKPYLKKVPNPFYKPDFTYNDFTNLVDPGITYKLKETEEILVPISQLKSPMQEINISQFKPIDGKYDPPGAIKAEGQYILTSGNTVISALKLQGEKYVKLKVWDADKNPDYLAKNKAAVEAKKKAEEAAARAAKQAQAVVAPQPVVAPVFAPKVDAPIVTAKVKVKVDPASYIKPGMTEEEIKKAAKAARARARRQNRGTTVIEEHLNNLENKIQLPPLVPFDQIKTHGEKIRDWLKIHKTPVLPHKPVTEYKEGDKSNPRFREFMNTSAARLRDLPVGYKNKIVSYTGSSYGQVNRALRAGDTSDSNALAYKRAFDQAATDLPDGIVLYRGMTLYEDLTHHVGSIIQDASLQSVSYGGRSAFSGDTILQLKISPGVKGIAVETVSRHAGEREIVLAANVRYQIDRVTRIRNNSAQLVEITVLPHG